MRSTDALSDHVRKLNEAYELRIRKLYWERDRYIRLAEQIAAENGEETATRMLAAQAEYIREQALQ